MSDTSFESRQWKSFADKNKTHRLATANIKKFNPSALILLICLCILWYFAAHLVAKPFTFPYFEDVFYEMIYALTDMAVLRNIAITFRRVLLGTLYGALIGIPVGLSMGFSKQVMNTMSPFVNAFRQIPTTAWVPLAIIWFGLGDGPTLFTIALHGVFVLILNTAAGVMEINKDFYNAVRSMGANTVDVIKDVVVPGSLPGIITGFRLALGMGWMTVVWAEFIATNSGFGYMIHFAQMEMRTERVMAYMAIAGLLGFFQDRLLLIFESLLLRWKR